MSGWYFYYQQKGGSDKWLVAEAKARVQILEQQKPAFVTVLNVNHIFSDEEPLTPEAKARLKYFGPLYFDFDCECIEDAIEDAQAMIGVLKNYDVDPECVEIFATGGRGFHFEVPINCIHFDPSKAPDGYLKLPLINKYIAFESQVADMDLRVYSAGRGRMWRTPNVQRDNGLYKVPVTVQEVMRMDVEGYRQICSQPRAPIRRATAQYAPKWADLYLQCRGKAEKVGPKSSKADEALVKTLKGQWSPTMKQMLTGEAVEPGTGFHKVAIQLAITAVALGKTYEEFIADAQPLCDNYTGSDSARYGTPNLRRKELGRMYFYIQENPGYAFSVGGLRSIMKPGIAAPDLSDLATLPKFETEDGTPEETEDAALEHNGVVVTKHGIFVRKEGELIRKSDLGLCNVTGLCAMAQYESLTGYQANVYVEGKDKGVKAFWMPDFQSKGAIQRALSDGTGCSVDLTDQQAGYVMDILRKLAVEKNQKTFQIDREGISIHTLPQEVGSKEPPKKIVVWAGANGVMSRDMAINGFDTNTYTYTGPWNMEMTIKSDLMEAPKWTEQSKAEVAEVIRNLILSNEPSVMARLLGWHAACHFAPWYRLTRSDQFPFLHPFGLAGSGKSFISSILGRLFVYRAKVPEGGAMATAFAGEGRLSGSSSIPQYFDEYKPSEMSARQHGALLTLMRQAYTASRITKGHVNHKSAQSKLSLVSETLSSPFVLLAEAQETQSAVVERCIAVHMDPDTHADKEGVEALAGQWLGDNRQRVFEVLSSLGKHLALQSLYIDPNDPSQFSAEVKAVEQELYTSYKPFIKTCGPVLSRPWNNMATVKHGFQTLKRTLNLVLEGELDGLLNTMEQTLDLKPVGTSSRNEEGATHVPDMPLGPRTELCKVISQFAFLSSLESEDRFKLREGYHFLVFESFVDIRVQHCWTTYVSWTRSQGNKPLYENEMAFMQALRRYRGGLTVNPSDSLYGRDGIQTPVLRLCRMTLEEDNVQEFYALKVQPDPK